MRFIRQGKAYQLVIRNGFDLEEALRLDEALWVAMSAPNSAYTCDPKFIRLVDSDGNGNITTEEVKRAIQWLLEVYPDKGKITADFSGVLDLGEINTANPAGQAVEHSAQYILADLKCECRTRIDLATVRRFMEIHTSRPLNGDGVMTLNTATECRDPDKVELMKELITDAVSATGGTADVDGSQGVTAEQYNAFLQAAGEYLAWRQRGELAAGDRNTAIMPFGHDTAALAGLLAQHSALIDDFFRLCQMQFFDLRLEGKVLQSDGAPAALDSTPWPGMTAHLEALPIVQPNRSQSLPLFDDEAINPLYRAWWHDFTARIIIPVSGSGVQALDEAGWAKIKALFAPYQQYMAEIKGACCQAIPEERLRRYTAEPSLPELGADLARRDLAVAEVLKEATNVEKLLLYLANLVRLCNNFISFPDLYQRGIPTLFEYGRLVIDSRWFNLVLPVDNLAAHSALAQGSNLFIIYFEIDTKPSPKTMVAPVTIGDKGNLTVGKRGIFFDLTGAQFNAKIVKVIENPVCVQEALAAPFSKISKLLEARITALSDSSQKAIEGGFAKVINDPKAIAALPPVKSAEAPKSTDKGGMLMGMGVAFAALSSALAFICKTLSSMSVWGIVISLLAVLAVLLLPISLLAIVKLRRQDVSSLLEGNGWAINARLRLTRSQRQSFSRNGEYPHGAVGTPRQRAGQILLAVLMLMAVLLGIGWGCWRYQQSRQLREAEKAQCVPITTPPGAAAAPAAPAAPAPTP